MKKGAANGAFFIYALSNLMTGEVSMRVDNVQSQHYFFIGECEKEKEVINYGMGTHEHAPF